MHIPILRHAMLIAGFYLVLVMGCFAQSTFTSGIINFDFYSPGFSPVYGPGAGAIGSSGDIWNGYNADDVGNLNHLKNNTGIATSVDFDSTEFSFFSAGAPYGTYGELFDTFQGYDEPDHYDVITGLDPDMTYNLVLYLPQEGTYTVNGTNFTQDVYPTVPYNELVEGAGYVENEVTADASGDLTFVSTDGEATLSAWQLEVIPEPSPCSLLILGILAMTFLYRFNPLLLR
ncbi:MAG TPA: hypothetical protein VL981_00610 [Candidatus Methylacidiphilales bacterium]|nr:hypothetical protein [Candidatus Methylacidiphilales bacterium]